MERPLFESTEQAVVVLWGVTARLLAAVRWLAIALLHTVVLALALLGLWLTGLSATDVAAAFHQSNTAAVLGTAGVSAVALAGAYWWLLRWLHRAISAPLSAFLLSGTKQR
jgi:hypothetical protein